MSTTLKLKPHESIYCDLCKCRPKELACGHCEGKFCYGCSEEHEKEKEDYAKDLQEQAE
jgi:hypothetical protein